MPRSVLWGFFMASAADITHMQLAIELAEKGRGKTSPNPMVGSVIVRGRQVISTGYHRAVGARHAEAMAIAGAGAKARGATLYVNLEPCCHTGRTGPCTEAIINAGISRVVLATKDPNPLVNGRGIRALKRAGITVETGCLRKEAEELNDAYLGYHKNGRPYVILKLAQSLDGRIATVNGDSKWITSAKSRKFAHQLRAEVDAVIVGGNTVRRDNPSLTVRHVAGMNPYRIVVTESLNLPANSDLISNSSDGRTVIASTEKSIRQFAGKRRNSNLVFWSIKRASKGRLDLTDLLAKADAFGCQSILVEGGSELATSFLRERLVDKFVAITSPILIGNGVEGLGALDINRIDNAIRLKVVQEFQSGTDRVLVSYPRWKK